jgi:hypothetical protein
MKMHANLSINLEYTVDYQAFQKKLELINFTAIAQILRLEHHWSTLQIERGIEQYQQLLFLLHTYPNQRIVPDCETDQVVHAHIATGAQYISDCQLLFNSDVDHEPGFGTRGTADRLAWLHTFNQTQTWIRQCFRMGAKTQQQPAYCVLALAAA